MWERDGRRYEGKRKKKRADQKQTECAEKGKLCLDKGDCVK